MLPDQLRFAKIQGAPSYMQLASTKAVFIGSDHATETTIGPAATPFAGADEFTVGTVPSFAVLKVLVYGTSACPRIVCPLRETRYSVLYSRIADGVNTSEVPWFHVKAPETLMPLLIFFSENPDSTLNMFTFVPNAKAIEILRETEVAPLTGSAAVTSGTPFFWFAGNAEIDF